MDSKVIRKSNAYLRIPVMILIIVMLSTGLTFATDQPAPENGSRVFSTTLTKADDIKYATFNGKNTNRIPVITYHQIVTDKQKRSKTYRNDKWCISESTFKQQMRYLHNKKYRTISCDEFYLWYTGKIKLPKRSVLITLDDGNKSAMDKALPVLKKYKMKATFFVIGKRVHSGGNGRYFSEKRMLQVHRDYPNIDFQSHTYNLHYHEAYDKSYNTFLKDGQTTNRLYGFNYIAYPYGATNNTMIKAYKGRSTGLRMAFTFGDYGYATRHQNRFKIKRFGVTARTSMGQFRSWCQ